MNKCILFFNNKINFSFGLLLVILALLVQLVAIKGQTQCGPRCISNSTHLAKCLKRAQDSVTLECAGYDYVNFIRRNDNKNISGFGVTFFSDNLNYSLVENSFNELIINKLRGIDSGTLSFQAIESRNRGSCNFSLYVYDKTNEYGLLKFGSTTYQISSEQSISFQIESFKQNLNVTYKYEALPLDYLLVNGQQREIIPCRTKSTNYLNCFETDVYLNIQKCQNEVSFNLSYGFANSAEYIGCDQNDPITAKTFNKRMNIICKCINVFFLSCQRTEPLFFFFKFDPLTSSY